MLIAAIRAPMIKQSVTNVVEMLELVALMVQFTRATVTSTWSVR